MLANKPFSCRFDMTTRAKLRKAGADLRVSVSEVVRRAVDRAASHGLHVAPRKGGLAPATRHYSSSQP